MAMTEVVPTEQAAGLPGSGTGGTQGAPVEDPAVRRALLAVTERLCQRFPWAPTEQVAALVDEAHRRTAGAKVDRFRVVLAEREARSRLQASRASASTEPAPTTDAILGGGR